MPDIRLSHIVKRFDRASAAVKDLSLTIHDGDFVTLLGPSGCGKTTILRMIAGLETPTEGEICIGGHPVFSSYKGIDVPPEKRNVGFIFQNYALWPHMTVYQNIAFGLENLRWKRARIRARVEELLRMLQLEEYESRYPSELSGGQQQRVAIARTLATNPQILLMDEPMSNLDVKLRMGMRMELKSLHGQTGSTFVYVTHDQMEAMSMSTHICLLNEGRLQQYGPPLEIYGYPANLFTADFVGSPGINLLPFGGENINLDEIALAGEDMCLIFTPITGGIAVAKGQKLVVGIRPEHIAVDSDGPLRGTVYSSLPSGMETIVSIDVGGRRLTSVCFGRIDFRGGQPVGIRFQKEAYPLFDADTGERLAMGRLEIV